ncbi:hypothetical protein PoB_000642700 [Plakobranchus ocellatus]|uniref:Uncharacterized protein n=1 Tax=Plakobranchus ocellatus TaxID=259542 RepID=A0AAV3YAT0_9GAST|nr:hypothetical protein PoB_000642700 [Plakobranchus ocellatus]
MNAFGTVFDTQEGIQMKSIFAVACVRYQTGKLRKAKTWVDATAHNSGKLSVCRIKVMVHLQTWPPLVAQWIVSAPELYRYLCVEVRASPTAPWLDEGPEITVLWTGLTHTHTHSHTPLPRDESEFITSHVGYID